MRTAVLALAVLLYTLNGAAAEDCRLKQIASLPITWTQEGRISVAVGINGVQKHMLFDTGAPASIIDYPTAIELSLTRQRIVHGVIFNSAGESASESAAIPEFAMGNLIAHNVQFIVNPGQDVFSRETSGVMGDELVRGQDVELNFADKQLNVFSQDHCPGQVVYWPADAVAVIPVNILFETGHIVLPVLINDTKMDALLDTGATHSFLTMEAAHNRLGISTGDMTSAGEMNGDSIYRYKLKTISFEGITINNPEVIIHSDRVRHKTSQSPEIGTRLAERASGDVDLVLGMAELKHFRIYIAYKEKKLYMTVGGH